jgi:hypothetical protein
MDRRGAQQRTRKRHLTLEVTINFASDPCGLDVSPLMPAITVLVRNMAQCVVQRPLKQPRQPPQPICRHRGRGQREAGALVPA